jgi:hypothetical protein
MLCVLTEELFSNISNIIIKNSIATKIITNPLKTDWLFNHWFHIILIVIQESEWRYLMISLKWYYKYKLNKKV